MQLDVLRLIIKAGSIILSFETEIKKAPLGRRKAEIKVTTKNDSSDSTT